MVALETTAKQAQSTGNKRFACPWCLDARYQVSQPRQARDRPRVTQYRDVCVPTRPISTQ